MFERKAMFRQHPFGPHRPALNDALGYHRDQRVLYDSWIRFQHYLVYDVSARVFARYRASRAMPETCRGQCQRFEEGPVRKLACPPVQVVNTVITGVVTMDENLEIGSNLEPPWLRVVSARRPPREIKNLVAETHLTRRDGPHPRELSAG